jgi:hypothetical protein
MGAITLVDFRMTNGGGDPGRGSGHGNGDNPRSPWEPWLFAVLAALTVAIIVIVPTRPLPGE